MPEVKNRQYLIVKEVIDATGIFKRQFHIPFHVDDIIVKSVSCSGVTLDAAGLETVLTLHMGTVGELFPFEGQFSQTLNQIFNVNRTIDGLFTFTVLDMDGAPYVDAVLGPIGRLDLVFGLEFVEFVR
jgi:hypothetical protein